MLNPLSEAGVNLTRIESRPSRRKPWEVAFFLDLEGHAKDAPVARALEHLRTRCAFVKVLGSHPRAWSTVEMGSGSCS
jgi:chorismate mutase/prephenate dehydratase